MRPLNLVAVAGAIALVASVPVALGVAQAQSGGASTTMPVGEIKAGMKGYGLTVFRGTDPERFDVEVIGILHQFRPHQDLVLIKTMHPRLEIAHVVAGMSGSPVYLEGRMIGAYAYGWQFGSEAIAGVTPIRSMLDELARPLPVPLRPQLLPLGSAPARAEKAVLEDHAGSTYAGDIGTYDLHEHARQLAAQMSPGARRAGEPDLAPVMTPILLGGVGERTSKMARELLEPLGLDPVQGSSSGDTKDARAPARFVDGGAIGVQMVRGDISAMGLGTVTRVEGEKLVAFGHPMMNGGVSALPTAVARVLWVLASSQRSFKLGEAVRPLGALVNDRQAAIVVDQKAQAPEIPVSLTIEGVAGAPHPNWSFFIAHEKFMAPSFLAMAVGNAIEATTSERRDVSWHATTTLSVHGYGPITLEDFGVSIGGTPDSDDWSHSRAVRALGALLNNPWEPLTVDRIATQVTIRFARDVYRLRGSEPTADVLDAGEPVRIRLHLSPFAGPEETRIVEVPIPRELAGKDVDIELAPGYQESPELAAPEGVRDLMANLPRQSFARDALVASIKLPEQGVAFHGQVAPRLPPGALDALRPIHDSASPEPFISYVRTVIPVHRMLEGKDRVRVHVRPVLR